MKAMLDHSVNFIQIKQAVQTRKDLERVHLLALSLANHPRSSRTGGNRKPSLPQENQLFLHHRYRNN